MSEGKAPHGRGLGRNVFGWGLLGLGGLVLLLAAVPAVLTTLFVVAHSGSAAQIAIRIVTAMIPVAIGALAAWQGGRLLGPRSGSGTAPQGGGPGLFWGRLLLATGVLAVGLCGLCTAGFTVAFLGETLRGSSDPYTRNTFSALLLPLLVGGPPIVIGAVLIAVGRSLLRRPRG